MKTKYYFIIILSLSCDLLIGQSSFTNYKVNSSAANQPNEVSIAVNPKNPNYLAAGSNLRYLYLSSDGGQTWTTKTMSSSLGVWGDPCLVYDTEGNLFYGHLSDMRNSGNGYWIDRIVVQKSTDNGINWNSGIGIGYTPPTKQQDKEWIGIDYTNSQYRNNIYMTWTEFDKYGTSDPNFKTRILFSKSSDQGLNWTLPIKISDVEGDCKDDDNTVEGAVPCVGSNGEIYVSWSGPQGLIFDRSLDGGLTFGNDIHVANLSGGWAFDIPGINRCNGMPITASDISNSPYKGNIYINWSDQKNNDTDIFFSKSSDGGNTWSSPLRVNNDNTNRHQFFTWMTVDPKTGIIYIIFYDRRESSGFETEVYLARSNDGGSTFQNFKISNSPFTPNSIVFFGDYTNITAYNGKIYPIWMRMDGSTMSVWTSIINDSDLVTDVISSDYIVKDYNLAQNYPNPFNPKTIITYQVPNESFVSLKVFDVLGKEIQTLVHGVKPKGIYEVDFDGSKLSSGIYLYRLETDNFISSKKMILLR